MKLEQYLDRTELKRLIDAGYISRRFHPTFPIKIYNYTQNATLENVFPETVCKCRGLIVDIDENVIARPFYKFWNLGQKEAQIDSLVEIARAYGTKLELTRKMDGMLGVLWNWGNDWGIATRGSFVSDGAQFATQKWQKFVKYGATEFVPKGWTLLFEVIAKHLRIVIPYDWEGLCLIGAVHNDTGREANYEELAWIHASINQYAAPDPRTGNPRPWCRLVDSTKQTLLEAQKFQVKGEEGWVVTAHRGDQPPLKAKIKYEDYCRLHRLITNVTPQMIWEALARPMSPWINHESDEAGIPKEFRQWVVDWNDKLHKQFHEILLEVLKVESMARGGLSNPGETGSRKNVLHWLKVQSPEYADLGMALADGKVQEVYEAIWRRIRPFGREGSFYHEGQGETDNLLVDQESIWKYREQANV